MIPVRGKAVLSALRERRIVRVACGVCEICTVRYPQSLLLLFCRAFGPVDIRDLVVVCPICREQILRAPSAYRIIRQITRGRSYCTRMRMRRAAGYSEPPYTPPVTADFAPVFEDVIRHNLGTFRLGG